MTTTVDMPAVRGSNIDELVRKTAEEAQGLLDLPSLEWEEPKKPRRGKTAQSEHVERERTEALARALRDRYPELREHIEQLAGNNEFEDDRLARELLLHLTQLDVLLDPEVEADITEWQLWEAVGRLNDTFAQIRRRQRHLFLDTDQGAIGYIIAQTRRAPATDIAEILGVTERTVRGWRHKIPEKVRESERVRLVAHILYYLRGSWTDRGLIQWFHREYPQLDNSTPLRLLNRSVRKAEEPLRQLARAARHQRAT